MIRKRIRNHPIMLFTVAALVTLSTHAGLLFYVSPSERHVEFNADVFRGPGPTAARAYSARYNQEYLLFQGKGAQAELIYTAMNNVAEPPLQGADALEFRTFEFLKRAETWKINRNQPKEWGVKTTYRSKLVDYSFNEAQTVTYIPYRLLDSKRHCFSFETKWDEPGYDPDFSPRQIVFGYYCARPGHTLTKERMQELIDSLHVRSTPLSLGMAPRPKRRPNDKDAALVARGARPDTGNVEFPIVFHIIEGQIGRGEDNGGIN